MSWVCLLVSWRQPAVRFVLRGGRRAAVLRPSAGGDLSTLSSVNQPLALPRPPVNHRAKLLIVELTFVDESVSWDQVRRWPWLCVGSVRLRGGLGAGVVNTLTPSPSTPPLSTPHPSTPTPPNQARERGHMHIADLVAHAHKFHNDAILLIHFSSRWGGFGVAGVEGGWRGEREGPRVRRERRPAARRQTHTVHRPKSTSSFGARPSQPSNLNNPHPAVHQVHARRDPGRAGGQHAAVPAGQVRPVPQRVPLTARAWLSSCSARKDSSLCDRLYGCSLLPALPNCRRVAVQRCMYVRPANVFPPSGCASVCVSLSKQ